VDLLGSPFHIAGASLPEPSVPPTLGQHTQEVLQTVLGLDTERIAQLREQGVV
jgi:crotonobetainyl-CoA:carnitine CoA-transferase CaiB-like acyl-CoA transferase